MKKKSLLLDFTPLLDVILILLFLVLMSSAAKSSSKLLSLEEENLTLKEQVSDLEKNQLPLSESEKKWYEIYQGDVGKMDLIFPVQYNSEQVELVLGNGTSLKKPQTEDFETWLSESINSLEQEVVILTFSYHNDSIYWKDYNRTRESIMRLSRNSDKKIIYEENPQE